MTQAVQEFLAGSPLAEQLAVPGRVVFRRFGMSLSEYRAAVAAGTVEVKAGEGVEVVCELEVGGEVIAAGSIEEKDGTVWFVPKEQ